MSTRETSKPNKRQEQGKMIKIWSMKKEEEASRKKKPKTSPAQLRVQKGEQRLFRFWFLCEVESNRRGLEQAGVVYA